MRTVLLLAILLLPLAPTSAAGAEASDTWWDEAWHFRLPLTLRPDGADPMTGRAVSLQDARDALVLVSVDFTASLRKASKGAGDAGWPFDAAGKPRSWTFLPESIRVVPAEGDMARAPLPARFLPFPLDATTRGAAPYDPRAHAAGTLVVLLPGTFDAPRRLDVYFDIAENGPKASHAPGVTDAARLDAFAGAGPGVSTMARVPPARNVRLHALPTGTEGVSLRVERISAGAAPELLTETMISPPHGVVSLPSASSAYDVRVTASAPVLLLLEARGEGTGGPTVLHAALEGGRAGRRFVVPPLEGATMLEVVGTSARTGVTLTDAATGAPVGTATIGRLASQAFPAPAAPVRVEASAPVLVLSRPGATGSTALLHQAAPLEGGAEGTILVGARADAHAATASTPATARAFPLARPSEILTGRIGDPPREGWASQAAPRTPPEAWAFTADAPLAATLGRDGYTTLHGTEARTFRVPFATAREGASAPLDGVLLAPFPETALDVRLLSLNGTLLASATPTLSTPGAFASFPDGTRLLRDDAILTVTASRPVFAAAYRPDTGGVSPLPMLPARAGVEEGRLTFYGPLLAWSEPIREVLARPGERARLSLELTNHGRSAAGAPVVEDVALALAPSEGSTCGALWEASLASSQLAGLPSPGARAADVFVAIPASAQAGECIDLTLRAVSSLDPRHAPEARLVVRARSAFQPELRVLTPEGPAESHRMSLDPGQPATALLRLRNLGAEKGRATLLLSEGPGYQARLVHDEDGKPVEGAVEVGGDSERRLRLDVTVASGSEAPWDFFVQAVDVADPTSRDEVVVSVAPKTNLTLLATLDATRLTPPPGGSANTTLRLRNLGEDVEVRLRLATPAPEGWDVRAAPERVLLRAQGTEDEAGRALDAADPLLTVTPPSGARVGDTLSLVLVVEPSISPSSAVRLPFSVLVANDFALDVQPPAALSLAPASGANATLLLTSRAVAPFDVALRASAAPRGWQVDIQGIPARIAPGEAMAVTLRHEALPGAPAGVGILRLELLLEDGFSPARVLPIEIPTATPKAPALRVREDPAPLRLAPREPGRVLLRLVNDGNAPADLRLDLDEDAGLDVELQMETEPLAPSSARLVALALTAPPPGFGRVSATVRDAATGGALARLEVVETRRDVAIADARLDRTPEGVPVLRIALENRGEATTSSLRVRLEAGDAALGEVEIPAILPGASAQHVLLAGGASGSLRVAVEATDGAPDADPANNEATLAIGGLPEETSPGGLDALREVPLLPIPLALLATVLAWGLRRRVR